MSRPSSATLLGVGVLVTSLVALVLAPGNQLDGTGLSKTLASAAVVAGVSGLMLSARLALDPRVRPTGAELLNAEGIVSALAVLLQIASRPIGQ